MLYIIDTQGTTQAVVTEPIYQGSTGVNEIILLAPFPANSQITVSCILPNGVPLRNVYPMEAVVLPTELQDINKNNYTCFKTTVNEMLTGLSGTVQVQFKVIQGVKKVNNVLVPRVLATYTTGFSVGLGVPTEPLTLPSDSDDINLILGYLASLNYDPITSVVYETDDAYRIADITRNEELPGVVVPFGTSQPLGIIQMFISSPREDVDVSVTGSNGGQYTGTTNSTIKGTSGTTPMVFRIYVNGDKYTDIDISFDKPLFVERIECFKPNDEGRYIINFRSGATADIDIAQTANALSQKVTSAQSTADMAMNVAEQARNTANNAASKATNAAAGVESLSQRIPTTVFCDSFSEVVETVFYDGKLKSGDVIIDTTKGTVDFIVCNSDNIGEGTTLIRIEDFPDNLKPPSAGDKYVFLFDGEELPIGIIAIESGINAPQVEVDSALSPTSTNPVQNKVVYGAIQATKDSIPVTTFCDSFRDVVSEVFKGGLKSGDWLIDTTKDTVDFVVCAYDDLGLGSERIDRIDLDSGNLPTPEAGDKFEFSDISAGVTYPIGIIAIEGGKSVDDELSPTSTNPVQNGVVTGKINELDTTIDSLIGFTEFGTIEIEEEGQSVIVFKLIDESLNLNHSVTEFYLVAKFKADSSESQALIIADNITGVNSHYFVYTIAQDFSVGEQPRYWTCHAREVVDRMWETQYPQKRFENVTNTSNRVTYNALSVRAPSRSRYPEKIEIYLTKRAAMAVGSTFTLYIREAAKK